MVTRKPVRALLALVAAAAATGSAAQEQDAAGVKEAPVTARVNEDGSVTVPVVRIPYSDLATPQAARHFQAYVRAFGEQSEGPPPANVNESRRRLDENMMIPGVEQLTAVFPVSITPGELGGVVVDVITPAEGVSARNRRRVLINVHGGGFVVGARYSGQMESIPVASLGGFKVVTVDYRMGPEYEFPAASEDVAKVYRALLEDYRPQDIGIFGCSAGGMLTAQSVAWLQREKLPMPGAIGMFDGAAVLDALGDSAWFAAAMSGWAFPNPLPSISPYLAKVNLSDPLVSPARSPDVLRRFPPSLLMSGTRDPLLSSVLFTHSRLTALGVEADLHVRDGAPHCAYWQPVVDPEVPEAREAWDVAVRFFDKHLGTQPARR
jgi:monoterpene epsilon-lactone hydrolase